MILFCDEDIGSKVPGALQLVGLSVIPSVQKGWLGKKDPEWLTEVGRNGWLAFSCNRKMLTVPEERDTVIHERVGIIFLTSGEERLPNTLRLILTKWSWLERIDSTVSRPFAFFLYPTGQTKRKL